MIPGELSCCSFGTSVETEAIITTITSWVALTVTFPWFVRLIGTLLDLHRTESSTLDSAGIVSCKESWLSCGCLSCVQLASIGYSRCMGRLILLQVPPLGLYTFAVAPLISSSLPGITSSTNPSLQNPRFSLSSCIVTISPTHTLSPLAPFFLLYRWAFRNSSRYSHFHLFQKPHNLSRNFALSQLTVSSSLPAQ